MLEFGVLNKSFKVEMMFKKITKLIVAMLCYVNIAYATDSVIPPLGLGGDLVQHGSFSADDLSTSPLLRSMFNLSANDVGDNMIRVCISPQNDCKVVRRDATVNVVSDSGRVKFSN